MGLLLGLGLLGAAFGIDAAKQAPFDRALRRLDNEWGTCTSEESRRCDALKYAVQNGLCFEDEKKPVIEWQKLRDIQWKYQLSKLSWPREAAIRDVCRLAALDRGFEYKGYLRNTWTSGYISDPENIHKLGIIGNDKNPKFSERRALMTGRILSFEANHSGELKSYSDLFNFLEKEKCTTQELYNTYARKFPDTFENEDFDDCYYNGLLAALNYKNWLNRGNEPQQISEPKKISLVTDD